jgi:methionine sulfoxide reductase heme-binding subunit
MMWPRAKTLLNHPWFFWVVLALPSLPMIMALAAGGVDEEGRAATEFLLHPTGEFAARFMIVAMMISPLRLLFPKSVIMRWLVARRRYLGVAAFLYALLHTLLYVLDMGSVQAMLAEFWAFGIWTGWLAMLVLLPLGLTSNNGSVRALGTTWKTLQRAVYVAALATLLHWMIVHNNIGAALVHFAPLAGLTLFRLWRNAYPSHDKQELLA